MSQSKRLRVACLQMSSTADIEINLAFVAEQLANGPQLDLVVLPENFAQMPPHAGAQYIEFATDTDARVQTFLQKLAQQHQCVLVAGSLPVVVNKGSLPYARCLIVAPEGVIGRYDKLHLFDVDVASGDNCDAKLQRYRESDAYQAGQLSESNLAPHLLQFDANTVRLGASICYDLRFPELYRGFASRGVDLITVPAAFTYETGRVHWEVLLRARAIENQAFVLAAAQVGSHANGRKTWGYTMIVDPQGCVIAQCTDKPGLLYTELDLNLSEELKQHFPVLSHRRIN